MLCDLAFGRRADRAGAATAFAVAVVASGSSGCVRVDVAVDAEASAVGGIAVAKPSRAAGPDPGRLHRKLVRTAPDVALRVRRRHLWAGVVGGVQVCSTGRRGCAPDQNGPSSFLGGGRRRYIGYQRLP